MKRILKRVSLKAQRSKKKIVIGALIATTTVANAAITMPTADYLDIEAAATIGFAVVLTVGLLMKAKNFFR